MEVTNNLHLSVIFSLLSLFINLISTETCEKQTSCSCKTSSGFLMDLKALPLMSAANQNYLYKFHPCMSQQCGGMTDVAVCQELETSVPKSTFCAGQQSTATFTGDLKAETLSLTFTCTDKSSIKRSSIIKVVCDKENKLEFVEDKSKAGQYGEYILKLKTKQACEPSSMSPGSTMLLIFFILLIVYLIGGILFKKFKQGASGIEMVPNLEFWKGLPSLIKDGMLFTFRGCKSDTTYSQI